MNQNKGLSPIKQTKDRVCLGASEIHLQRSILQGISFKTRPIKTLVASLNEPPCFTLLQALVAPGSGWGPLGRPGSPGGLPSGLASLVPLLMTPRVFLSENWVHVHQIYPIIHGQSGELSSLHGVLSIHFSAGCFRVLQKTALEYLPVDTSGSRCSQSSQLHPLLHWHQLQINEAIDKDGMLPWEQLKHP